MTRWNGSYLGVLQNTSVSIAGGIWNLKRQTLSKQTNAWPILASEPIWVLDFSTGSPSGYVFLRGSTGTFIDSLGYITSASNDVARLTHDSSGNRLGLLIEESRTNFEPNSEDGNSGLNNSGTTVTANDGLAPDNTTTADRWQVPATGWCYKGPNGIVAGTYVLSFYIKQKSSSETVRIRAFGNVSGVVAASTVVTSSNWQRVELVLVNGQTQQLVIGLDQRTGVGGPGTSADVLVWGFQVETGSVPSSYIKTTGSSVTRSADIAYILDSNVTSWGDPGALCIYFYPPGKTGSFISTDTVANEQLGIEASGLTAARAFWSNGSTPTGTITTGVNKAIHYWNGNSSSFCINGGTVQTGNNNITTFGNIDYLTFGSQATSATAGYSAYSNCIIRKIEFYSGILVDQNLKDITT